MVDCEDVQTLLGKYQDTKDVSLGAQTHRYTAGPNLIIKVRASPKSLFSEQSALYNMDILSQAGIPYPEGAALACDLSSFDYQTETPVLLQERADEVYHELGVDEQEQFLNEVENIIDIAAKEHIGLDTSITNFGRFEDTVKYLDVQDNHSVRTGIDEDEIRAMYDSLAASKNVHDRRMR